MRNRSIKAFQRLLFGADHPYAQPYTGSGTKDSITKTTRQDLINFYKANYVPNNSTIVVVGDISLAEATTKFEKTLKSWKKGTLAKKDVTTPARPEKTRLYIVDKPGAPQSTIVTGDLGIPRSDPQYIAKTVANEIFGGQFTSRLNLNLREDKGYTYGARSLFLDTRGVGPFISYANVEASTTDESIREIIKEMKDVIGAKPYTMDEVENTKANLIRGFPHGFQSYENIAQNLSNLAVFGLPLNEWTTYLPRLKGIDAAMATRAIKEFVHPDQLTIIIVGDRALIEPSLRVLNIGEVTILKENQ